MIVMFAHSACEESAWPSSKAPETFGHLQMQARVQSTLVLA